MTQRLRLLVVDDDASARAAIAAFLSRRGEVVRQADDGLTALAIIESEDIDIVLSDVRMPNMDGVALAHTIKERGDDSVVILMSGYSSIDSVVGALREGAYDFLLKPIEPEALAAALGRVHERFALRRRVRALSAGVAAREAVIRLTTLGAVLKPALELVQRSAQVEMPLLLTGCPTDIADLLALAIHGLSSRAAWPHVRIDLATVPEDELETTMFGSGPERSNWGAVRKADRGVLVLHGAECLSSHLIARLAQVAHEHGVTVEGARDDVPVDVRIVCSTARSSASRACADLAARLRTIEIAVPPGAIATGATAALTMSAESRAWLGSVASHVVSEIHDPIEQLTARLGSVFRGFARLSMHPGLDATAPPVVAGENPFPIIAEELGAARQSLEHVRDVMLDLRALARCDASHEESVDLRRAIERAVELSQAAMSTRARFLKFVGQLPPVRGSEARYRQLFVNLLSRATRAIPAGAPETHLIELRAHADGSNVHVFVRDSGEPIPKAMLERLFDPFERDSRSPSSRLGLVVAHTIVTSFGGEITVESAPDEGTTVRVTLPTGIGDGIGFLT